MKRMVVVAVLALAAIAASAAPKLQLAAPFTDGAVLQRGRPIPVWGKAKPGAKVQVEFARANAETRAKDNGEWRVDLQTMPACKNGRTLRVLSEGEELEISDVLVGEVWLCSGQSNMGIPFWGESPRARDRSGYIVGQITRREHIRCAKLANSWSVSPRLDQKVVWNKITPDYLVKGEFSAVAIWFALTVDTALADVPIGLLGAYVGATGIDTWTPRSVYAKYPQLKDIADYPVTENWTKEMTVGPLNGAGQQPTCYFNGKLASIVPYSMRGVLWYQGEHNVSRGEWKRYKTKMHAFYDGLAAEFENPALKLYFAQLAPWGNPEVPFFQMEQEKYTDEQPNSGMAYICDTGNLKDIHPNDKESVGRRLALIALKRDYGLDKIVADAPRLSSAKCEAESCVRLRFKFAKEMFALDPAWCYKGNPAKSVELGFELAGADGKFYPAQIKNMRKLKNSVEYRGQMDGEGIVLYAPEVTEPARVRYLHNHPWFGRITNEAGLPLGPFDCTIEK